MSTLRSTWSSRSAKVLGGVVAFAVTGLVASMALTGPATAGAGEGDNGTGWPTHLANGDGAKTARVARESDHVVKLRARTVRDTDIDADGDGQFGPGDYFVFEDRLFRRGEQVGRDSVRCMLNHRSVMCDGTIFRGGGNVEVAGGFFFSDRGALQIAVTGGTGRYRGAAGTLVVRNVPGPSDLLVVRLVD